MKARRIQKGRSKNLSCVPMHGVASASPGPQTRQSAHSVSCAGPHAAVANRPAPHAEHAAQTALLSPPHGCEMKNPETPQSDIQAVHTRSPSAPQGELW
jgi:hypothetical protein